MIYCVEDDDAIRGLMTYALNAAGLEARGFTDGSGLFEAMGETVPQLILLDIMLPGEDGIAILKRLRGQAATADIPVIMASAKGTEYDRVTGLDLGADDYLSKPFGMTEMVSRVRAVLRRYSPRPQERKLSAGGLELSPEERTVTAGGAPVQLTYKEFELLRLFMSSPGTVFTRERLLDEVWDVDYSGETRTVDMHIKTLRQKLGECGSVIKTVRGVGYRLEAPK